MYEAAFIADYYKLKKVLIIVVATSLSIGVGAGILVCYAVSRLAHGG